LRVEKKEIKKRELLNKNLKNAKLKCHRRETAHTGEKPTGKGALTNFK